MSLIAVEGALEVTQTRAGGVSSALNRIEQQLAAVQAKDIERSGNRLSFRGGYWGRRKGDPFSLVGASQIEILPGAPMIAKYRFSLWLLFLVSLLVAVGVGVVLVLSAIPPVFALEGAALGWLILVGANRPLIGVQLRGFMRVAVGPGNNDPTR